MTGLHGLARRGGALVGALRGRAAARWRPRYTAALFLLFCFSASSVWLFHRNSFDVTWHEIDDLHTLVLGTHYLSPFDKPVITLRVGEMNRHMVRLLYPAGIWYMNGNMGNTVKGGGWKFPGGYYLKRHYSKNFPLSRLKAAVGLDPNVQDYVFAMRFALGMVAVSCFCLALWALFGQLGPATAVAYASLVFGGAVVWDQFRVFYSESVLLSIFHLAVFLCVRYRKTPSYRNAAYLGILSAAAMSTKLVGILVAVPAFLYVACNMRGLGSRAAPRIEVFLLFALASMVLLNLNAVSLFEYVNQTIVNVYHYGVGHWGGRPGSGYGLLRANLEQLGWPTVLAFALGMAWLARSPALRLVPVYALGAAAVLVLWSFSDAVVFFRRNMAPVYVAMSLVAALAAGDLFKRIPAGGVRTGASAGLALLLAGSASSLFWGMPSLGAEFFDRIRSPVQRCETVHALGLEARDLRALREAARGEVAAFPRPGPPLRPVRDADVFAPPGEYGCLVVRRGKDTRQVTNHLAREKGYTLRERVGPLFFFVRPDAVELTAAAGDRSIALTWAAPDDPEFTRFQTRWKTGDGPWRRWSEDEPLGAYRYVVRYNLRPGVAYGIQMRMAGDAGDWSPPVEARATTLAPDVGKWRAGSGGRR